MWKKKKKTPPTPETELPQLDEGVPPLPISPTTRVPTEVEETLVTIQNWLNDTGAFNLYAALMDQDNVVARDARRLWGEATSGGWFDDRFEWALYELWDYYLNPENQFEVPVETVDPRLQRARTLLQSYLNDEIDQPALLAKLSIDSRPDPLSRMVRDIILDHQQALPEYRRWTNDNLRDKLQQVLVDSYGEVRGYRGPRRPGTAHTIPTTLPTMGGQRRRGRKSAAGMIEISGFSNKEMANLRAVFERTERITKESNAETWLDPTRPDSEYNPIHRQRHCPSWYDGCNCTVPDKGQFRVWDDKRDDWQWQYPDDKKNEEPVVYPQDVEKMEHFEKRAPSAKAEILDLKLRLDQLEKAGRLPDASDLTDELETNEPAPPDLKIKRDGYDPATGFPTQYHDYAFCSDRNCKRGHW